MSDTTLRRKARKVGMQLTKLRENSPWYAQYGPYLLTLNGQIEYHSMDSETAAEVLEELLEEMVAAFDTESWDDMPVTVLKVAR
ncbi:hypothetical protein LT337_07280 [Mycolicibacterium fortuitum]|nr:hypothetical protein LT337_07280 [Mycolicibacterium fortuitum]